MPFQEQKQLSVVVVAVSVMYRNEFLPGCTVRFKADSFDSGPIPLTTNAFPVRMNVPLTNFRVALGRPWTQPGEKPVLGAEFSLNNLEGSQELVFLVVDRQDD